MAWRTGWEWWYGTRPLIIGVVAVVVYAGLLAGLTAAVALRESRGRRGVGGRQTRRTVHRSRRAVPELGTFVSPAVRHGRPS
jgi:hypothetical protein